MYPIAGTSTTAFFPLIGRAITPPPVLLLLLLLLLLVVVMLVEGPGAILREGGNIKCEGGDIKRGWQHQV